MNEKCPLCSTEAAHFFSKNNKEYFSCDNCYGVFMGKDYLPDDDDEIFRYNEHNNDVNDPNYQNFVKPIVNGILNDFNARHKGIDFGAGTGPVISKMLIDKNYNIVQYDPFFHNYPQLLENKYDYIACCEVIEHFHNPYKEFNLLNKILNPSGKIYCMTNILNDAIDFKSWYYKDDPTHVFFYRKETFEYIRDLYRFRNIEIKDNLIVFRSN